VPGGAPPAQAAAAAAAAVTRALERMVSHVDFALVLVSPAAGVSARAAVAAALEAALLRLPVKTLALGVSGATVLGPEELPHAAAAVDAAPAAAAAARPRRRPSQQAPPAAGTAAAAAGARDTSRAVCVLLGRVPGCIVRLSTTNYPSSIGSDIAPADPRVARWLRAPPEHTLAWCALFLAPARQLPLEATPHVARAWPHAALVGGVASARGGTAGAVAIASRSHGFPCTVQPAEAPALAVWAPLPAAADAAAAPPPLAQQQRAALLAAAAGVRGLVPCGAVWAVHSLTHGDMNEEDAAAAARGDPSILVPFTLSSGGCIAPPPPPAPRVASDSLWHDVFVTAFEMEDTPFVRVWADAPPGAAAEEVAAAAAARAAARAFPAEPTRPGGGGGAQDEVRIWAPADALMRTPLLAAALDAGRLRCQVLRVTSAAAAADAASAASSLAAAVSPPLGAFGAGAGARCVLAAACSGRGEALFDTAGVEARALATAFPHAFAGVTVDGELGPPPEGGLAVLQSFTTTLAALGA
jgi:hypothetical protein